jgi:hypothetical protein
MAPTLAREARIGDGWHWQPDQICIEFDGSEQGVHLSSFRRMKPSSMEETNASALNAWATNPTLQQRDAAGEDAEHQAVDS